VFVLLLVAPVVVVLPVVALPVVVLPVVVPVTGSVWGDPAGRGPAGWVAAGLPACDRLAAWADSGNATADSGTATRESGTINGKRLRKPGIEQEDATWRGTFHRAPACPGCEWLHLPPHEVAKRSHSGSRYCPAAITNRSDAPLRDAGRVCAPAGARPLPKPALSVSAPAAVARTADKGPGPGGARPDEPVGGPTAAQRTEPTGPFDATRVAPRPPR
jgi:hypothetical protein